MADGFQKYFNSTTTRGRANVAKATYATFAILYLIYRVRRGSAKKPTDNEQLLAESKESTCNCDKEREPIDPDAGLYDVDPECATCRERAERAMTEFDREEQLRSARAQEEEEGCNGFEHPPPPPPPSQPPPSSGGAGASPPKRKCPCDESQTRKSEVPVRTSQTYSRIQQPQHRYVSSAATSKEMQQARPVSEIIGQVNDAVCQALRTVVAAVMGGATAVTNTILEQTQTGREDCNCNSIKHSDSVPVIDPKEDADRTRNFHSPAQAENEQREEEVLLPRRTAPRSCVPTHQENSQESTREQKPPPDADHSKGAESQQQPIKEHYRHSFSDGFAADMYFETADE